MGFIDLDRRRAGRARGLATSLKARARVAHFSGNSESAEIETKLFPNYYAGGPVRWGDKASSTSSGAVYPPQHRYKAVANAAEALRRVIDGADIIAKGRKTWLLVELPGPVLEYLAAFEAGSEDDEADDGM